MQTYTLSNGHQKELLVRGRTIYIALPSPFQQPDDLLNWARDSLPDIAGLVKEAKYCEFWVNPLTTPNDAVLTEHIGPIVEPEEFSGFMIGVLGVLVRASPPHPRGEFRRPRWPAEVR